MPTGREAYQRRILKIAEGNTNPNIDQVIQDLIKADQDGIPLCDSEWFCNALFASQLTGDLTDDEQLILGDVSYVAVQSALSEMVRAENSRFMPYLLVLQRYAIERGWTAMAERIGANFVDRITPEEGRGIILGAHRIADDIYDNRDLIHPSMAEFWAHRLSAALDEITPAPGSRIEEKSDAVDQLRQNAASAVSASGCWSHPVNASLAPGAWT